MSRKPRRPITAGGYVEAGRVQFDNRRLFDAALSNWNGQRVVVAIAPEIQSRTHRATIWCGLRRTSVHSVKAPRSSSGLAEMFAERDFSEAWEAGVSDTITETDTLDVDEEGRE